MNKAIKRGFVGALAVIAANAIASPSDQDMKSAEKALQARQTTMSKVFVQNLGQWDKRASYLTTMPGMNYWVRPNGVTVDMGDTAIKDGKPFRTGHSVDFTFVGANRKATLSGLDKSPVRQDYMERGKGVLSPDSFSRVNVSDLYRNIDLHHYFSEGKARYDLVVEPGASASTIKMRVDGATKVAIDKTGDLTVGTRYGDLKHGGLFAYQMVDGKQVQIPAKFQLTAKNEVGFTIGQYDKSKPLVIDPLVYGSYFGGDNGRDKVNGVVSEPDGSLYVTGWTDSPTYPVLQGAYQTTNVGGRSAFVTRFRGDAYTIEYSTYLGGSGDDEGLFIGTNKDASIIWVLGKTSSPDFPVLNSPFQPNLKTDCDLFLFRFQKDPVRVLVPSYGTYVAPDNANFFLDAASDFLDPQGFVVTQQGRPTITGFTDGTFPAQQADGQGQIYLLQFDGSGRNVLWSRHFGDNLSDVSGLATDINNNLFISGTCIPGMTLYGANWDNARLIRGDADAYIAKFAPGGGKARFIGAVGGSDADLGHGIALDGDGNPVLLSMSGSFDFPRTQGTFGQIMRSVLAVTKVRADASVIMTSTGLNTGNVSTFDIDGFARGIAVDRRGNVVVTGKQRALSRFTDPPTEPPNPDVPIAQMFIPTIPTTADAVKTAYTWTNNSATDCVSTYDSYMIVLDSTMSNLLYGSWLGTNNDDDIRQPYVDNLGDIWVFGITDTSFGYIVPGRPPTGGGNPPNPKIVSSQQGLPAAVISPLAFKAIPEPTWETYGPGIPQPIDPVEYAVRWSDQPRPPSWYLNQFVQASARSDGFIFRFRFGAPQIQTFALQNNTVAGGLGATTTGAVVLSQPAPPEGATITIVLADIDIAEFTGSPNPQQVVINLAAGETTGTFTLSTKPVTSAKSVQLRALYAGDLKTTSLTVVPWLVQLAVTPDTLRGGFNSSGRVTLVSPAPAGGVSVALASDNTARVEVPATVTVPEGFTSLNFTIPTKVVDTTGIANITASLLGVSRSAALTTQPLGVTITKVTLNPTTVDAGQSSTGTVSLSGGAPDSGFKVDIATSDANIAQPSVASITIPAGQTAGTFTVKGGVPIAQSTATITASAVGSSKSATLTVKPVQFTVSVTPSVIPGGTSAVGTVSLLNGAVAGPAGLTFAVGSTNTAAATANPTSVTIGNGQSSANFTVNTSIVSSNTTLNITAASGGVTKSAPITVNAAQLISFTFTPTTMRPFINSVGTVTIDSIAPAGGVTVNLAFNESMFSTYPAGKKVVIPAGSKSVSFNMAAKAFSLPISTTITASAGGASKSVLVTIIR